MLRALARGNGRWNTGRHPLVGNSTGASALSPTITLELRFSDRDPEIVRLGPGRTIVGRESGDILLHDPEASALHAEIEFTKGHVIVRDLGSSNGTWREGKRLPQFALYPGQVFRCGTTDICLVELQGADTPSAGGTASGSDKGPGASSTLPSAAIAEVAAAQPAQTISRGVAAPPSATATTPGSLDVPVGPNTLVGPGPAPMPAVGPAATVVPPLGSPVPPVGAPPTAATPTHVGSPTAQSPVADAPGPDSAPPPTAAPTVAPAAGVPVAVPAAASAPVANAVIKLGDARPRAAGRPPRKDRTALKRTIFKAVAGVLGVGLIGALIFGIYSLIAGRDQAFLRELAQEMPQDTVGVVAIASPREAIALFGDEVPAGVREQLVAEFGVDPLSEDALENWGIDADAPLGLSLLDGTGMVALSLGVTDQDALRSTLSTKVAEIIEAEDDLRWIDRSFADTPGLWLDEPMAAAVLLKDDRAIVVMGGPADDVARHATRVAETGSGKTLADSDGFGELVNEPGRLLFAMYVDGPAGRSAIPGKGMEGFAARVALADIDGFALMVSDDGPDFHVSTQTVVHEGTRGLAVLQEVKRKTTLIDTIPGPALAAMDGVFSPEQIKESMGTRGPFGLGASAMEDGFREETSLDLRTDIVGNLDGRYGVVMQALPLQTDDEVHLILWAGVKDEAAAKQTADRFFSKMQEEMELKLQQVSGTTVYTVDDNDIRVSYFIHEGVLWATIGDVDLAELVEGKGTPYRDSPRIPALKKATNRGGQFAGFADVRSIIDAIRGGDTPISDEDWERAKPILDLLEAVTARGELDDRTFIFRITTHTSSETGLSALVQGVLEVVGEELAEDLARERRAKRCDMLIDHIVDLMKAELASPTIEDDVLDRRYELLTECQGDETTESEIDCMLAAKTLKGLSQCENKSGNGSGDGIPVDGLDQPEPTPVPYIDDIWPNTEASGTDSGRPNAAVNYAVPLGDDAPLRGPKDALVTVIMFGDFQCPYCKRVLPALDQLLATQKEVRLAFRNMPLAMHPQAENAARAAIAAGQQGKFWEMHDKLYDNQAVLSDGVYSTWAGELGLDVVQFDRDFHDGATNAEIAADKELAKRFGVSGTPAFFINGRHLTGSQSLEALTALVEEEKTRATTFVERRGNTRKRLYRDMISHFAAEVIEPPPDPIAVPVAETRYTIPTADLPRRGTGGYVPVEIVECGDFDCPFCERANATLDRIRTDYEGKVALFWLHNPLSFHAGAEPAARAAVAAHNQGKFWEMHDKLFEDRKKRDKSDFVGYARELGLDVATFEADFSSPATAATVVEQQKRCVDNDGRGTPTFFINGRLLSGAQPYDSFKDVIDQELSGGI